MVITGSLRQFMTAKGSWLAAKQKQLQSTMPVPPGQLAVFTSVFVLVRTLTALTVAAAAGQ